MGTIRNGKCSNTTRNKRMVYRYILTESQLGPKLATLKGSTSPVYLLFIAAKTGENGQRWCGDCRSAEPVLEEAFDSLPASATLLEVEILRDSWKVDPGPKHPFRSPPFAVKGIPSLLLWNAVTDKVEKRFTENECEQLENLQQLFLSHF